VILDLRQGECPEALKDIPDDSVDSVVTDPPAGISFMGKEWDGDLGGRDQWVAWLTTVMLECFRVLKPGGHILVWGIPRTSHWTALAIEEAGFRVRDRIHDILPPSSHLNDFLDSLDEVQLDAFYRLLPDDSILCHLFGSGFPHSKDIGKAIDAAAGDDRKVLRTSGEGTALKPAVEHWILAQKPLAPVSYEDLHKITGWTRWYTAKDSVKWSGKPDAASWKRSRCYRLCQDQDLAPQVEVLEDGQVLRWIHEERWVALCPEDDSGWLLKGAKGEFKQTWPYRKGQILNLAANTLKFGTGGMNLKDTRVGSDPVQINRFVNGAKPFGDAVGEPYEETLNEGRWPAHLMLTHHPKCGKTCHEDCPVKQLDDQVLYSEGNQPSSFFQQFFYTVKASSSEKQAGLEDFKTGQRDASRIKGQAGSNNPYNRGGNEKKNTHPTVKSVRLMCYLVELVTPQGGTVLDPFMGSGTTGIAARKKALGFIGVEKEPHYFKIAKARIKTTTVDVVSLLTTINNPKS